MRWPWVLRTTYDQLQRSCDSQGHELYRARMDKACLETRYDALLEKYHAMKLQGGAVPEPPKTLDRPAFDPVVAAITAKAGPDRKLRAIMSREAMAARNLGISDSEIIQQIEQGVAVDEGIPL